MLTDFGTIDPTALITLQKANYLTSFDLLKVNLFNQPQNYFNNDIIKYKINISEL